MRNRLTLEKRVERLERLLLNEGITSKRDLKKAYNEIIDKFNNQFKANKQFAEFCVRIEDDRDMMDDSFNDYQTAVFGIAIDKEAFDIDAESNLALVDAFCDKFARENKCVSCELDPHEPEKTSQGWYLRVYMVIFPDSVIRQVNRNSRGWYDPEFGPDFDRDLYVINRGPLRRY